MDFSQVKAITIPEGSVNRILSGATVLWEKTGGFPAGYQQVEYIESTGTQYIDTGVLAASGLSMDERMSYVTVPNDSCFVGARTTATRFYLHHTYPGKFAYGYNTYVSSDATPQAGVIYNIHTDLNVGDQKMYVDGVEVRSGSNTVNISLNYTLYIFCMNRDGNAQFFTEGRLYELKLYKDGDKIRDFVPCYRKSDGEIGLYDFVSATFFTNSGSGTFIKGADVT